MKHPNASTIQPILSTLHRSVLTFIPLCIMGYSSIFAADKPAMFIGNPPWAEFSDKTSWASGEVPDENTDIILDSASDFRITSNKALILKSIKNSSEDTYCRVIMAANPVEVTGDIEIGCLIIERLLVCKGTINIFKSSSEPKGTAAFGFGLNPKNILETPLVANKLRLNGNSKIKIQTDPKDFQEVVEAWKNPLAEIENFDSTSGLNISFRTYPASESPMPFPPGEYPFMKVKSANKPEVEKVTVEKDFAKPAEITAEWRGDILYLIVK